MFVQLPLKIGLKEDANFDTFVAETEVVAMGVAKFQQGLINSRSDFILLEGESKSGKTHLLQAACRFFSEKQSSEKSSAVFLPLSDKSLPLVPPILEGLETVNLICIDDVDEIIGKKEWELALASLIVKSQVLGKKMIVSSKLAINNWAIVTKELSDAMMAASTVKLSRLKKTEEIIEALTKRSKETGFEFSFKLGDYLIKKFSSNLSELIEALDFIEKASIIQKRKITIYFVKQILADVKPEIK